MPTRNSSPTVKKAILTWLGVGLGGCLIGGFLLVTLRPLHGPGPKPQGPGLSQSPIEKALPDQIDTSSSLGNLAEKNVATELPPESSSQLKLSPEDQKKWEALQEILVSRNDNDPRIDKEFKNLSDQMHRTLQAQYHEFPLENRNQRGLIAFLIARDLKDTEDLEFLKKIYQEAPCLSLENCGSRTSSDPHLSGIDESSMNYPQLVSLYQLEAQLRTKPELFLDGSMKDHARAVIEQALRFPVNSVQKKAAEIQSTYQL